MEKDFNILKAIDEALSACDSSDELPNSVNTLTHILSEISKEVEPKTKLTKTAILVDAFSKYSKKTADAKIIWSVISTVRKELWSEHFGVPTINFELSYQSEIDSIDNIFITCDESSRAKQVLDVLNSIVFSSDHVTEYHFYVKENIGFKAKPDVGAESTFVKTLNSQGYMTVSLDSYSKKFIENVGSLDADKNVLEIGAAYGVATLQGLNFSARYFANDLDSNHLKHIEIESKFNKKLELVPGEFPYDLDFPNNYFDAALICRVLHFFTGKEIESALKCLFNWMSTGGCLYIIGETPYLNNWSSFIPDFQSRKESGEDYPGEIFEPKKYENNRTSSLPPFVHWFDVDTISKAVKRAGFSVVECDYIDREGQFPDDLLLDGRESVGIIARKL